MWSQIILEASTQKNFNFGFASYKSEITLHLSQWQYWWWFWFSFVWCLYFFILFKNNNEKIKNYNIIINTSLKGHGKWGDFLVSIIPLSWCGNILINSNYILRMIEWQNETSFMTIRVQGKQWYWVYKYDSTLNNKLKNIYINIGNNNWQKLNKNTKNLKSFNSLVYDNEFLFRYFFQINKLDKNQKKLNLIELCFNTNNWNNKIINSSKISTIFEDEKRIPKFYGIEYFEKKKRHFKVLEILNFLRNFHTPTVFNFVFSKLNTEFNQNNQITENITTNYSNFSSIINNFSSPKTKIFFLYKLLHSINFHAKYGPRFKYSSINLDLKYKFNDYFFKNKLLINYNNYFFYKNKFITQYNYNILNDIEETNNNIILNNNNKTFYYNYSNFLNVISKQTNKITQPEQFWGFRQKKIKKLKTFNFTNSTKYLYNINNNLNFNRFNLNNLNKYNTFILKRNNKHKNEIISVNLARRLLRTKRTLVLPVHLNLTIITNSYDVIHSWFIPGLGLKLDCVPGRSTHHSFYIENIGFYYGQCAEICGRYHHHMPIRVCALSFEHFLIWWQSKGLKRILRQNNLNKNFFLKNI